MLVSHDYNEVDRKTLLGTPTQRGLLDVYMEEDNAVSLAWMGLLGALSSVRLGVDGLDAEPRVVRYVRDMLYTYAGRFTNSYIASLLQGLYYGCAPHEIIFKRRRGQYFIESLEFIHPRYILDAKKKGTEWWATGHCWVDGKTVEFGAPFSGKPVLFWPHFGQGIWGRSLLLPALPLLHDKLDAKQQRRVALQKSVQGVMIAKQDPENPCQGGEDELARALALAANGDDNGFVLPPSIQDISCIYPAQDAITKTLDIEKQANIDILSCFGMQYLGRGLMSAIGGSGNGELDSQSQLSLREYFCLWLAHSMQPIIDMLIDLNFGPQEIYPEMKIISPNPLSPRETVASAVQLSASGALKFGDADQEHLRQLLRLPMTMGDHYLAPPKSGYYNQNTGIDNREFYNNPDLNNAQENSKHY